MTHRLRFNSANELFEAHPEAREDMLAQPDDGPSLDFLRKLAGGATPEEAITFASYLLPRREAVWWSHQCLHYLPEALTEQDHAMLTHAENWVREAEEETRRAALDAALEAETKTPGVWVALAAGWSGGSMSPAEGAAVPPPPFLTARAVNAAVLGLLARVETQHREQVLLVFVDMAVKLTES